MLYAGLIMLSNIMLYYTYVLVYTLLIFVFLIARNITFALFDSRGIPVQRMMDNPAVVCRSYRGARLQDIARHAEELIPVIRPTSCLIVAGVNNLTHKNRHNGTVLLIYYDPFELANHIIRLVNRMRIRLTRSFPTTKICFGGVIGMNLNKYNKLDGISPYQWILDEAIRQINAYLRLLCQQSQLYYPRLTSKVHAYYRGKPKNNYRLLSDGLHLGPIVCYSWVTSINRFHWVNTLCLAQFWAR